MRWVVRGGVVVILFDAASALASKAAGVRSSDLGGLILVGLAVYFVTALLAARESRKVRTGLNVGAGVAVVDATVGSGVAALIIQDWAWLQAWPTVEAIALVVWVAILWLFLGGFVGLVAGLIAVRWTRPPASAGDAPA